MALNVLVIPEDFRKDQYVLKPMITKLFGALGQQARVRVCQDPLLGGIGEALKWERSAEIIERYPMVDLFLLIVDRDGNDKRRLRLDSIEERAREKLDGTDRVYLAEAAIEELEVWILAGLKDLPAEWPWAEIRADTNPKERYYEVHAQKRGLLQGPAGGRAKLAKEAASNYKRVRKLSPELADLERRVVAALSL